MRYCHALLGSTARKVGFLVPTLILWAVCGHAYNPNQPQGFGQERAYHEAPDLPDQVDLFSGRLSVTIPVGPFSLFYNNNVWRYSQVTTKGGSVMQALPDRNQTAGLGWHLGWGELYAPGHWYNNLAPDQWLYVGHDGTRHAFYRSLHLNEDDGEPNVYYTRDGSYLRLRQIISGSTWEIDFPDGVTRRFVKGPGSAPYRLTKVWDTFGSSVDWDVSITYDSDDKLRTVRDRDGRIHYVRLAGGADLVGGHPLSFMNRVVTEVDVQGFGGQRTRYRFTYRNTPVDLSCKNESSAHGSRVRLPHLVRIDLPDAQTSYVMEEGGVPSYINTCGGPNQVDDAPGSLTRMKLPGGGVLRWTYQEYNFPPGDQWGPFNTSAGVKTREAVDVGGEVLGSWHYRNRSFGTDTLELPEVRTDVVSLPEGDCQRHYFNAVYWYSPQNDRGWRYGLPFVTRQSSAGKFLSRQEYANHVGGSMLCSDGSLLRTHYVRYRHDPLPGVSPNPDDPHCQSTSPCSRADQWHNSNRTADGARTIYHDDNNTWIDVEMSEFDGLGNFRRSVTTGNFLRTSIGDSNPSVNERREVFVNFTRSPGEFDATLSRDFTHPSSDLLWVLRTMDAVEIRETGALDETVQRTEYVHDPATGALQCTRILRSGTNRSRQDILITLDRDSRGLVVDSKRYGGDRQLLPYDQGTVCAHLPTQPEYWQRHTYLKGVRTTSRPIHPDGTPGSFLIYDVTVDPSTGVVTASRDRAGFAEHYSYDTSLRLTQVSRGPVGAVTTFDYLPPTGATGGRTQWSTANGSETFAEGESVMDGFGRDTLVRLRMPDGSWSERETLHNARGWVLSVSEPGAPGQTTRYLDYDPFGRPGRVVPPEGAGHETRFTYQGQRVVTEQRRAQLVRGSAGEAPVVRTREMDTHGRLRFTRDPQGVTTTYDYNVSGVLSRILTTAGATTQVRRYQYDNRGFLLQEKHPEKGAVGNGQVQYQSYDSSGNARYLIDGSRNLQFDHDFLGRLTKVYDRNRGNRILRSFFYDTAAGYGKGKLYQSVAHNYQALPWGGGEVDVTVIQRYTYHGVGGTVSHRDTLFGWPNRTDQFRTVFTRDANGNLASIRYPWCVSADCAGQPAAASDWVNFDYDYGRLTSVPGWASIDYHPSGLWSKIAHSNKVEDRQALDAFRTNRPARIWTTGAAENYNSGNFAYDGRGSIKTMGGDTFAYDALGRLKEASLASFATLQSYTYDAFGNLLRRDGNQPQASAVYSVNSSTNRMTDASYDGAGNLLEWGGKIFEYDPFNRLTRQAWMQYLYDAEGERVASLVNTGGTLPTIHFHLRGMNGELLSDLSFNGVEFRRQLDTVYGAGRLLGAKDGSGERRHYHVDHLGTPRLITREDGSVLSRPVVLPYGTDLSGDTADKRKLSEHERDFSTGTDYMHARHYSSAIGRFLSVDTERGIPSEPQSLNRNAYVMGNPLNYKDPDGRFMYIPPFVFTCLVMVCDTITVTGEAPGRRPGVSPFPGGGGGRAGGGGGRRGNPDPSDNNDGEAENPEETPDDGGEDEEEKDPGRELDEELKKCQETGDADCIERWFNSQRTRKMAAERKIRQFQQCMSLWASESACMASAFGVDPDSLSPGDSLLGLGMDCEAILELPNLQKSGIKCKKSFKL